MSSYLGSWADDADDDEFGEVPYVPFTAEEIRALHHDDVDVDSVPLSEADTLKTTSKYFDSFLLLHYPMFP